MIFPNKDTSICISVSKSPGNFGCFFHNTGYKELQLNYIYKSFGTEECKAAIDAVRTLGIKGCSVTMPYKEKVLNYVDKVTEEVSSIGATNTIVNVEGKLVAHNTDTYSSFIFLKKERCNFESLYILGNGGYSKAVEYSAKKLKYTVKKINRNNWDDIFKLENCLIFNCTPVKNLKNILCAKNNTFIDCCTKTDTGSNLAFLQGVRQFFLYTGCNYPISYERFLVMKGDLNV
jgi:shikimate 5-dehydrogenase